MKDETSDKRDNIYKMKVFADSDIKAKSKFWYYMKRLNKIKKANGEILAVNEIFERDPSTVKNFGIVSSYQSSYGIHTMYKEYRSTSLCGAIEQLYQDLAGRHRGQRESIHIIRTTEIQNAAKDARRYSVRQLLRPNLKFPKLHNTIRPSTKQDRSTFQANRPLVVA